MLFAFEWLKKKGDTAAVGSMKPEMAKQLKAFEKENMRLKKMAPEQALEMQILKGAGEENWQDLSP